MLTSGYLQTQFRNLAAGTVVKNISGDLVKKALLPISPMEQQHKIVAEVGERLILTHRLATTYERKLAALDDLKKSLLHQAFSGNLQGAAMSGTTMGTDVFPDRPQCGLPSIDAFRHVDALDTSIKRVEFSFNFRHV